MNALQYLWKHAIFLVHRRRELFVGSSSLDDVFGQGSTFSTYIRAIKTKIVNADVNATQCLRRFLEKKAIGITVVAQHSRGVLGYVS